MQDFGVMPVLEERSEVLLGVPTVTMVRNDRNFKKGLSWSRNGFDFTN